LKYPPDVVVYGNEMEVCITAPDDAIYCGEWGMGRKMASKPHPIARGIDKVDEYGYGTNGGFEGYYA
jgi:hypothetical protein